MIILSMLLNCGVGAYLMVMWNLFKRIQNELPKLRITVIHVCLCVIVTQ